LAGGIAHDLNNILAPILMAVQLLRMKYPEASNQQLLATLESSAKRGGDLVKQVLTFARGVQGERVALQPKHLILEVEKMARQTFPKVIEIVTEVPKDLWTVKADSTQLHQVLMNLCVNARDAMQGGGTLTLSTRNMLLDDSYASMNPEAKAGAYVVIEVSDTGTGIPADIIDKIFDPFFTTKELGEGTGLGLSTTLAIVKAYGGFVNVYSEPGKGTQFTVYLPAVITAETQRVGEPGEVPLGHGELILVVDDEAAVRDIARATLEAYNYRAITAADGAEAVASYAQRQNEIAVVLSDSSMPVMDGVALARALKSINPAVNIVSMSGLRKNGKTVQVPLAPGIIKVFLPKPFTAEQLIRTLHEVLEKS
jgi:CheY-like chemotaxis protein